MPCDRPDLEHGPECSRLGTETRTCFGMLRHTETEWNRLKMIQGRKDSPLTPAGEQQARRWGRMLGDGSWHRILCSDAGRARQTADLVNESLHLPIIPEARLREQDWGLWTGKSVTEIREADPDRYEEIATVGWSFQPPNGESRFAVLTRVQSVLEDAHHRWPGENILVVTHQMVILCLMQSLSGRNFDGSRTRLMEKDHFHLVVHNGDRLRIKRLNVLPPP